MKAREQFKCVGLILTIHLLMPLPMVAQEITFREVEQYADRLVEKEILTNHGREVLLRELREGKVETEFHSAVTRISHTYSTLRKETILQFCASAFLGEMTDRMFQNPNVEKEIEPEDSVVAHARTFYAGLGRGGYTKCISSKRSTIGLTRTRTLNDIKQVGLISDRVYQECQQKLQDKSIVDEPSLLAAMVERTVYYTHYEANKNEQIVYIANLVSAAILTKEEQAAILNSYKPFELKTIPDILSHSARYLVVDLSAVEAQPEKTYPVIFDSIRELLPNFHFSDLKLDLIENKDGGLIRQDIKIAFKIDSVVYSNIVFHNYRREIPDPKRNHLPSKVDQGFNKGVNKWLTDIGSPYRLFTVSLPIEGESPYGDTRVGLLLLKNGQAKTITTDGYLLSRESFDSLLSRKNIRRMIVDLSSQGLFSHLSKSEIDSALNLIGTADISSIVGVLAQFPKTLVVFDWESANLENPYQELTTRFGEISRGKFQPTRIMDEFEKGFKGEKTVKFSFDFDGIEYESELPFNGDWLDPHFMEMIRQALKEKKVDGDYYQCVFNGQEGGYVFLSKAQYAYIQEKYPNLLRDPDIEP